MFTQCTVKYMVSEMLGGGQRSSDSLVFTLGNLVYHGFAKEKFCMNLILGNGHMSVQQQPNNDCIVSFVHGGDLRSLLLCLWRKGQGPNLWTKDKTTFV